MTAKNLTPHHSLVTPQQREALKGHKPLVLWFTGLSGSGKSTIAAALEQRLVESYGAHTVFLDGDSLRHGLNQDLGFSAADRQENIRRVGQVARLMFDAGLIVITSFISPYRADRDQARALFPPGSFWEVFVDCPLETCKQRDPKGLYAKAESGEIAEFTGVSSPYEAPQSPEIHMRSDQQSVEACVGLLITRLVDAGVIQYGLNAWAD